MNQKAIKTSILLGAILLSLNSPHSVGAATETPAPTNLPALVAEVPTPRFDEFMHRFAACEAPFIQAKQWFKVVRPTLEDLGYTADEIKSIKQTLSENVTKPADAVEFCKKWQARYGEHINARKIYELLPHENAPAIVPDALAAK